MAKDRQGYRWKIAVYCDLLLSSFFSPGTPTICTLIVTGVPMGGVCVSGICASAGWPAFVWLSVLVAVIGLPEPVKCCPAEEGGL